MLFKQRGPIFLFFHLLFFQKCILIRTEHGRCCSKNYQPIAHPRPDRPFPCCIWDHPVETQPVTRLLAVLRYRFTACTDIPTVGRHNNTGVCTLTAELIYYIC